MRFLQHTNINFVRWKWHAIALSLAVIGAGIVTVIQRGGLPLGVDFAGGTELQLKFEQPTNEETVRRALAPLGMEASVQQYGPAAEHKLLVRLPMPPGVEQGTNLERECGSGGADPPRSQHRQLRAARPGDRRSRDRRGSETQGTTRHRVCARWHSRLHRYPVPVQLRGWRHRRDAARRARDAGVSHLVRVRPLAQHHRGDPDDGRLFRERHDRHLRPRA